MNARMSGWSTLRITIFAARRVLPPLLITPAKASNPFMKETGPEAVPPPASSSREERRVDKLLPVPDPYLNSIPSVLARVRIESIESSIELMKQAEHWGCASIRLRSEVAPLGAPAGQGVDDAADQPTNASLALGSVRRAAKVLRGHHVGREHRPGLGDFDVLLLKDGPSVLATDVRGAVFPGQLVRRVDARRGEIPGHDHSRRRSLASTRGLALF